MSVDLINCYLSKEVCLVVGLYTRFLLVLCHCEMLIFILSAIIRQTDSLRMVLHDQNNPYSIFKLVTGSFIGCKIIQLKIGT